MALLGALKLKKAKEISDLALPTGDGSVQAFPVKALARGEAIKNACGHIQSEYQANSLRYGPSRFRLGLPT